MSEPLYPNRPAAVSRLVSKYGSGSDMLPFIGGLPGNTQTALRSLDTQRANVGQFPLNSSETLLAGTAAAKNRAVIKQPDKPWWQDLASDAQSIASSIPKLPISMIREAQAIPEGIQRLPEVLQQSSSPVEQIGNVANLPGFRLLPGSFVASQFGTGGAGVGGLTEHPLFTAMDVLPYAEKAARLTKTVRAAEDLAKINAPIYAEAGLPHTVGPLSTLARSWRPGGVVTETVQKFGQPVERVAFNPVFEALDQIRQNLRDNTHIGNKLEEAFGPDSRAMVRRQSRVSYDASKGNLQDASTVDQVGTARAIDLKNRTEALKTEFKDLSDAEAAMATSAAQLGSPEALAGLSPRQAEYVAAYRPLAEENHARLMTESNNLVEVPYEGRPAEIHTPSTAKKIMGARYLEDSQLAGMNLRATLDPANPHVAPAESLLSDLHAVLDDTTLTAKTRAKLTRGYQQALEDQGYVTGRIKGSSNGVLADFKATLPTELREIPRGLTATKPEVFQAAVDGLGNLARSDPTVADLVRTLKSDPTDLVSLDRAKVVIDNLKARGRFTVDDLAPLDEVRGEVMRRRRSMRRLDDLKSAGFTDARVTKAEARRLATEASAVPARWDSAVQDVMGQKIRANLEAGDNALSTADSDRAIQAVADRAYSDVKAIMPEEYQRFRKEAAQSWQELADQGYDPVFVHHVSNNRAMSLEYPNVANSHVNLSAGKERLDPGVTGPQVNDLALSLRASAMEFLMQQGTRAYVDDFLVPQADTLANLRKAYGDVIDSRGGEMSDLVNREGRIADLIARDHLPFDPTNPFSGTRPQIGKNPETQLMLPRALANNLSRMAPNIDEVSKLISGPMKIFRTSVLALSPRWHVYNTLGNAVNMMLRAENPLTIWKYTRDAIEMTKRGGPGGLADAIDTGLRGFPVNEAERTAAKLAPGAGMRQEAEFMRLTDGLKTPHQKLSALHNYAAGSTIRRWLNDVWESKASQATRDRGNKIVQGSYDWNETVDNFFRSMSYLEGHDKGLMKGLTGAEATAKGIQAARAAFQNFDNLTPLERTAMRFVFPFYSWMRTLTRYVATYPADHPWRMSIMSGFARAEDDRMGDGLPQRLKDLLFLGDTDSNGNVSAINLGGANPFRDVANYFTLGGFLSGDGNVSALTTQLNPAIGTLLQWAGVDPASGSADLYPEVRYDPVTGSLTSVPKESPLASLVGNFLPQARTLQMLTGQSQQYKDLARRNPAAAARMLASSAGLPVLSRKVNQQQEVMKAEVQRYKQMRDDLNSSMKAGDLEGFANRYPGLRAFAARNAALTREQRQPYAAQEGLGNENMGIGDVLKTAGKSLVPGLG